MLLEIENARKAKKPDGDEGIDDGVSTGGGNMDEEELGDDLVEDTEELSEDEEGIQ